MRAHSENSSFPPATLSRPTISATTSVLDYESHSNPEWQDLQRQLLVFTNIWRRENVRQVATFFHAFLLKQLWSSHVRQSKQKLTKLSTIQQRAFNGCLSMEVTSPAPEAGQGSVPHSTARRESRAFACSVLLSKHCPRCAIQPE